MRSYLVQAYRSLPRQAVEVLIGERIDGKDYVAQPKTLTFSLIEDHGVALDPTLVLPIELAQRLMQALWDEGFRPDNGEGQSAHVDALKSHIRFAERVCDRLMEGGKCS